MLAGSAPSSWARIDFIFCSISAVCIQLALSSAARPGVPSPVRDVDHIIVNDQGAIVNPNRGHSRAGVA
jgi:hypothetical protein